MACFDYEQVECSICHQMTADGYIETNGRIVCDECSSKNKKLIYDGS